MEENSYSSYQYYLKTKLDMIFSSERGNVYTNVLKDRIKNYSVTKQSFRTYNRFSKQGELSEGLIWKAHYDLYTRNQYKYFDENGNVVLDLGDSVQCVSDFHDGLACVIDSNGETKYIDKQGKTIINLGEVKAAGNFYQGVSWFTPDYWRFYFIDKQGNKSKNAFQGIWGFSSGYGIVSNGPLYNVVNREFELVGKWENRIPSIHVSHNFEFINDKMIVLKNYLEDYDIKKTLFGYECKNKESKNEKDVIKVKYQPVKIYYDRFVLCVDNKCNLYLFDKNDNSYTKVDSAKWVEFDDNFILSKNHFFGNNDDCFVVYFVYDGDIVDITDYYNEYLNGRESFNITPGLGKIFTYNEFQHQDDKFMVEDHVSDILGEDTLHRRRV